MTPSCICALTATPKANEEIKSQRLSPEEIVALEQGDPERAARLCQKNCARLSGPACTRTLACNHLFHCGAGLGSFTVSYDGTFRLCSSLWHPECIYDLRQGRLPEAWAASGSPGPGDALRSREFSGQVPVLSPPTSASGARPTPTWKAGHLDAWVEYFCRVAQAWAQSLGFEERKKIDFPKI